MKTTSDQYQNGKKQILNTNLTPLRNSVNSNLKVIRIFLGGYLIILILMILEVI